MYLEFPNYNLLSIIIVSILFFMLFYNTHFSGNYSNNNYNLNFLQNSYAIQTDDQEKINTQDKKDDDKDSKETDNEEESNNKGNSIFNFVAVGDWDCTGETEDTVENILAQDPELVLALEKRKCIKIYINF
jgi:hypothetical protein